MFINRDLSTEAALASFQNPRPGAAAGASQPASAAAQAPEANPLDSSLQRLTDIPAGVQDAGWEIQDEQGAGQTLELARQGILRHPGLALNAQANQLSQNVMSLLQPVD